MPHTLDFGTRRVMRMGYSRYVILPKIWLKHVGMENYGELSISMNNNGDLVISPAPAQEISGACEGASQ